MGIALDVLPESNAAGRTPPGYGLPTEPKMVFPADGTRFDFDAAATPAASNERLQRAVDNATVRQDTGRKLRMGELPDSNRLRELAGQIKQHALDYLDYYLLEFKAAAEARGAKVHFASSGEDAKRIILEIAKTAGVSRCIKSKSMASEEIELAHVLELAGIDIVETDLGEFILQINNDKPSHLVAPIIHMDKAAVARLFSQYFGTPYSDDPVMLTRQARAYLRDKFRSSDFGITGGNFLIAETGQLCSVENEGNVRQSTTTPRVLVSLVGIEKMLPRLSDLAVLLKLLARSATGQPMTVYTSIFGGVRAAGEKDGPEEVHIVLLDNGRTRILEGEYRETLRCIRCAACLNVCPIYRKIGGHAYGSVYPGPIGALITPLFKGLENYPDLPKASSLCGACYEACPVKINIPKHLINLRRDMVGRSMTGWGDRIVFKAWAVALRSEGVYKLISTLQKFELRRRGKNGWVDKLPKPAAGWTNVRSLPVPAKKTFREIWNKSGRNPENQ